MQQLADLRRCVDRLEAMHSYWQPVGTLLSADIMRGAEALGLLFLWRRRTSSDQLMPASRRR